VTYELPKPVTDLSADEITSEEQAAVAAFDTFSTVTEPSDEDVAEMERLASIVVDLRTERERKETAKAERTARAAAARAAMAVAPAEPVQPEQPDEEEVEEEVEEEPAEPQKQPQKRAGVASIAAHAQRPVVKQDKARIVLSAAADVPGFALGSDLEGLHEVAKAVVARMRGFPAAPNLGAQQQFGVAVLRKEFPQELVADGREDQDVVDRAAKENRLPGGSLVAAGGWCAPSETVYDLCAGETTEGLISVPEIQVSRGGIRYTTGPDFSDIYTNSGFCQTEAQAIAGTTKPCYEVTCPPFQEVRLDACGICIKAPILTNAAYPELVQRVVSGALVAHQHKMSVKVINAISTALGTAVAPTLPGNTTASTLSFLELAGEGLRSKYRLGLRASLEVIAPHWLRSAIRADLANRSGVDALSVSDQQIDSHFAARNLSVQWVYGYQPLPASCPTDYPATAEVMVYPAGTFVKGVSDIISLNAVYDTASLVTNVYTALFVEEGVLVTKTCYAGCKLTIPVCGAGQVGAFDLVCAGP
jgi:hypothetical protein